MSLAREAYEAYCSAAGGKSLVTGDPLPSWEMLPEKIQHAWLMSAAWVAGKVNGHHDWKEPLKDAEIERLREENAELRERLAPYPQPLANWKTIPPQQASK